jgi:tetratricopeptide (TPR) repeat protein
MRKVLRTAIELHRSGRLEEAASLYRSVLSSQPENAEALQWFGVLHCQIGDPSRAVELIGRAVALKPDAYLYHGSLAEAHRAAGDPQRAAETCRAALRLWANYPEALCTLGSALSAMGRHDEAVESLRRAVELRPGFVVAHNNLGIALRELGRPDEALEEFRRAVELDPTDAPARTNLGQMLLSRGEAEEALTHCREAVRLEPNSAELHDNLGHVLLALDRLDEAWNACNSAVRLDPAMATANARVGLILQKRGHFAEAIPWLKRAVERDPDRLEFWEWLAELHDERDDPAASIPCWERVLALEPGRAPAHLSLGRALQDEGRLEEARAHYLAADELEPQSGAPLLNLGWLHELLGEMDKAEAQFRAALERQPNLPIPHARLATLLRGKLPDGDLAALEARLADEDMAPAPRARLLFGLAHVLDGRSEYARAAECLTRANAMTLELARGRHEYSPVEHERHVDSLVRAFDRGLFARLAGAGLDTRRPVFVFGLPRSGTTLIEQVLASHSAIHGAGELRLARRSFDEIPAAMGQTATPGDCIPLLGPAAVKRLAERHLDRLTAIAGGPSPSIVDKMPENYLYLGLLSVLFPRATFIHCRRDLRDVAVSCWMTDFSSIRWANEFGHIASRFHEYRRIMEHWRTVLPLPVVDVNYEDTVKDLEGVARKLIAACGLEWEPACLEFHRTERPVRTASVTQVRQPVYQRSVARWKNYEPALAELFAALPPMPEPPHPSTTTMGR